MSLSPPGCRTNTKALLFGMEYSVPTNEAACGAAVRRMMMQPLTPLGVAILALLAERPMHPYEMFQLMTERRADRLMKVRPGSLYHTVGRLEAQELVRATGTDRAGNRPERTTYAVTESGRARLGERIVEILAAPVQEYPLLPLGLAEAHNLDADLVVGLLKSRIALLEQAVATTAATIEQAEAEAVSRVYLIDLSYQRAMHDAELDWIRRLVEDIRTGAIAWPHYSAMHDHKE